MVIGAFTSGCDVFKDVGDDTVVVCSGSSCADGVVCFASDLGGTIV